MAVVKKLLWFGLFGLVCLRAFAQQDPQFSLGFMDRTFTNPAYVGNTREDLFCASVANRLELTKFDGAPVTSVVGLHGPLTLFGIPSGVGITFYNDMAGALRAPGLSLTYAYRHKLPSGVLSFGLSAGLLTSWYANGNWRLPDGGQADPAVPTNETAGMSFDMSLGAYYESPTLFGGVSCKHLTAPELGVDKTGAFKQTLYLNTGYRYTLSETEWMLMPMLDLVSDFAQTSLTLQATAWFRDKYWGGLGYRWGQAVAGMVGAQLFEGLNVAYAYEFYTSSLNKFSGGSHELIISYSFSISIPRGSQRYKSIRYL